MKSHEPIKICTLHKIPVNLFKTDYFLLMAGCFVSEFSFIFHRITLISYHIYLVVYLLF